MQTFQGQPSGRVKFVRSALAAGDLWVRIDPTVLSFVISIMHSLTPYDFLPQQDYLKTIMVVILRLPDNHYKDESLCSNLLN